VAPIASKDFSILARIRRLKFKLVCAPQVCDCRHKPMRVLSRYKSEAEYPGWLSKLMTDPVRGLENYGELFNKLTNPNGAIKVFCEVANL